MAGQDTASFDEALKTVYEQRIVELLPAKLPVYQKAREMDAREWGGRYVEFPSRVRRNAGVAAYAEMGAMATAGKQGYATTRIPMRFTAGRVQLSAQVIEASRAGRMAFAPALSQEMDGLVRDIAHEHGRMIHSDGRGVLAYVNGDPSTGTTITVDAPGGVAGATNGNRFIPLEGIVTFVTPATGAIVASAAETVTAIPSGGTTFTIGSAAAGDVADNNYIVRAANASVTDVSDTNYAKEPMGLRGHVDDGTYVATYHNINRTTYPIMASHVITLNGALSSDVLQRAIDVADQRGEGSIETLVMHHSVRRAYIGMTDDQRRYSGTDLSKPDAGTVAAKKQKLTYGGIELMEDRFCDYGTIYGMDWGGFERWVMEPGRWMRHGHDEGSVLMALGTGSTRQHAYEAIYYIWQNFHHTRPNACFRIDGVTATVTAIHID